METFEDLYENKVQNIASELIHILNKIAIKISNLHRMLESYQGKDTIEQIESLIKIASRLLNRLNSAFKKSELYHLEPRVLNDELIPLNLRSKHLEDIQKWAMASPVVESQEKDDIFKCCNTYRTLISALYTVIHNFNERHKNNPQWITDLPNIPNF